MCGLEARAKFMEGGCLRIWMEAPCVLRSSTIQPNNTGDKETRVKGANAIPMAPHWQTQPWFASATRWSNKSMIIPRGKNNLSHMGPLHKKGDMATTPLVVFRLWNKLTPYGLDKVTTEHIVSFAWWEGTFRRYSTYLKKWGVYGILRSVKPLQPTRAQQCRFFRILAQEGLGYGAGNTARCALSVIPQTVGKHQLMHWLLRSV